MSNHIGTIMSSGTVAIAFQKHLAVTISYGTWQVPYCRGWNSHSITARFSDNAQRTSRVILSVILAFGLV